MLKNQLINQPLSGIGYLLKGMKLLAHPKLRAFVIVPLCINILIFVGAFWALFSSVTAWIDGYINELPDFLSWLSYLFWPLLIFTILFGFSFLFSIVANLIAAPFNGVLAEKTENLLTNTRINDESFADTLKDLPRIFKRELQKLGYFLPRLLFCFALHFIPVFGQTIAPFISFIFAGWMMAIQYADFPFDNHKIEFKAMRKALGQRVGKNLTFGLVVGFCTTVPFVNFIIMPIAVCGATAFWVDIYKQDMLNKTSES
ncbi:sulfate transporter CysZ [Psychromonas sp. PT13]|uniref:sulfate transporter CysZ n=1 Tax=Psychromonas sp. PT13 TaxID=3439547 RepID=UPI003EC11E81